MNHTLTTDSHLLRFDPHITKSRDVVRAGTIGRPRTLSLEWSFDGEWSSTAATAGLVDIACLLLDSEPAAIYAVAAETGKPPLIKLNVLVTNGGIASLEAAWEDGQDGHRPTQRHLHLIGTDGELHHRLDGDNVLWSDSARGPLPRPDDLSTLRARAIAADTAGDKKRFNAIADAISTSLSTGEMVRVGTEESGS